MFFEKWIFVIKKFWNIKSNPESRKGYAKWPYWKINFKEQKLAFVERKPQNKYPLLKFKEKENGKESTQNSKRSKKGEGNEKVTF